MRVSRLFCTTKVRQSMVVDFDQFIEPLQGLPRKSPEQAKSINSVVAAIDKEVLIQSLEQESLFSFEKEFERAISTAHAEDVSAWIDAIAYSLKTNDLPMRLLALHDSLQLPIIEVWLGLLLGNFKLEQKGTFYDSNEIWIG